MAFMSAMWLPILLSSIAVFIVSSIIHMASPWHKTDYPKLSNEEQVMDALRPLAIAPGDYFMPRPASMADMKSAEFKAKICLLYTSPSPRDPKTSRMPSSA